MGSDRYLAVKVRTESPLTRNDLVNALTSEAIALLGDAGAAALDLWIYDVEENHFIAGCRTEQVNRTRAAIACLTEISGNRVAPRVTTVSGTIRSARARME